MNVITHGLRDKIKEISKKSLGENIYNGHRNEISTKNAFYSTIIAKFKARAQKRHEKFNGKKEGILANAG